MNKLIIPGLCLLAWLVAFPARAQTAPVFTSEPSGSVVNLGDSVTLSASVSGAGVGLQWLKDGVILPGQTGSSLSFGTFQFTNCGSYLVVATNAYGMAISYPAIVTYSGAPVLATGENNYGQLGFSQPGSTNSFVTIATGGTATAMGALSTMLAKNDGSLWTVGYNHYGQLGNGTTNNSSTLAQVANNVVGVAAGAYHSLLLQNDGTVWAGGNNTYGQLGDYTTIEQNWPGGVGHAMVAAAAGAFHSLMLKTNGTLWVTGNNAYGQFGNGNTNNSTAPASVATNVVAVAAGGYHTLYLTSDRRLWAMGDNSNGQLGNGNTNNVWTPVSVATNVVTVSGGRYHTLFVTGDGSLWAMGYNAYGQLGLGTTNDSDSPAWVASNVVAVAAGEYHSLFTKNDGTVWGMGLNTYGQLGLGNFNYQQNSPVLVPGVIGASLGQGCLALHSLAVAALVPQVAALANQVVPTGQPVTLTVSVTNGTGPFTYQWQLNGSPLSGANSSSYTISSAALTDAGSYTCTVTGMVGAVSVTGRLTVYSLSGQPSGGGVSPGRSVTLSAAAANGSAMNCQWLKDGVVLLGQTNSTLAISSFAMTNAGNYQVVFTNATGMALTLPVSVGMAGAPVQVFGANGYGQLGLGAHVPTNVPVTLDTEAVAVAAGSAHSLYVKNDGSLWGMGYNNAGQLGLGNYYEQDYPVQLASGVVSIAAGYEYSLYVGNDGILRSMGYNNYGQLGNGNTSVQAWPVMVASNVVTVTAGVQHSLFLENDGTLWGMGANVNSQLGQPTSLSSTNRPLLLATNVITAAAGNAHTLFIKTDGTLWAMGANYDGQLGVSNYVQQATPVLVTNNVIAVAAGCYHSLFVKTDGTLWAMGDNNYGQLGNGNTSLQPQPVLVATNVVAVAAGQYHSLFEKADGTLWAMGYNFYGQLGDGNYSQPTLPVLIPGLVAGSLGALVMGNHSLAVAALLPQSTPLTSQTVLPGNDASFSLSVTNGTGPFTYQWQFNGADLSEATGSSYSVSGAEPADGGAYTAIVTGLGGSVTNRVTLNVLVPPVNFTATPGTNSGANQVVLTFSGTPSYPYILETSTNLADNPVLWQPVSTNATDANGNWHFTDTNTGTGQKFYQIIGQ